MKQQRHEGSGDTAAALLAGTARPLRPGEVCLVGAGPGDPELLTIGALNALRQADLILYDRLVSAAILALAAPHAEQTYVGKARARHHCEQGELNQHMIEQARAGRRVVRLKGGDPFLFGRGGEEATALLVAGIPCRVIPGITAGSGCATYAGIPLTHRDCAQSCIFLTAHDRHGEAEHDWADLVRQGQTLVVYMGLAALERLCPRLIAHGMPADRPAALIERGTLPEQRVFTGTVATLPQLASTQELHSPALVIIGEVVHLRATLRPQDENARAPGVAPAAPAPEAP